MGMVFISIHSSTIKSKKSLKYYHVHIWAVLMTIRGGGITKEGCLLVLEGEAEIFSEKQSIK